MSLVLLSLPQENIPILGNPIGGSVRMFVELVDPNRKKYTVQMVKRIVERHFGGATITRSEGLWEMKWSPSVIVWIINRPPIGWKLFLGKVRKLEQDLLKRLNQDEILVEELPPQRSH